MTRNSPDERCSAAKAVQDWWTTRTSSSDSLVVPRDVLEHTQHWISDHFTAATGNNRPEPRSNLIHAVVKNPELPLKDERLVVDVVRRGEELLCSRLSRWRPMWIQLSSGYCIMSSLRESACSRASVGDVQVPFAVPAPEPRASSLSQSMSCGSPRIGDPPFL